jgi:hypothetical protein
MQILDLALAKQERDRLALRFMRIQGERAWSSTLVMCLKEMFLKMPVQEMPLLKPSFLKMPLLKMSLLKMSLLKMSLLKPFLKTKKIG